LRTDAVESRVMRSSVAGRVGVVVVMPPASPV
jgi:hypothetical protein